MWSSKQWTSSFSAAKIQEAQRITKAICNARNKSAIPAAASSKTAVTMAPKKKLPMPMHAFRQSKVKKVAKKRKALAKKRISKPRKKSKCKRLKRIKSKSQAHRATISRKVGKLVRQMQRGAVKKRVPSKTTGKRVAKPCSHQNKFLTAYANHLRKHQQNGRLATTAGQANSEKVNRVSGIKEIIQRSISKLYSIFQNKRDDVEQLFSEFEDCFGECEADKHVKFSDIEHYEQESESNESIAANDEDEEDDENNENDEDDVADEHEMPPTAEDSTKATLTSSTPNNDLCLNFIPSNDELLHTKPLCAAATTSKPINCISTALPATNLIPTTCMPVKFISCTSAGSAPIEFTPSTTVPLIFVSPTMAPTTAAAPTTLTATAAAPTTVRAPAEARNIYCVNQANKDRLRSVILTQDIEHSINQKANQR